MVRRTFGWAIGLVGLLSFLYLFFFVPLGQRTLWQHALRIAATEPAQQLGTDLRTAGERLEDEVRSAAALGARDAGPEQPPRDEALDVRHRRRGR